MNLIFKKVNKSEKKKIILCLVVYWPVLTEFLISLVFIKGMVRMSNLKLMLTDMNLNLNISNFFYIYLR